MFRLNLYYRLMLLLWCLKYISLCSLQLYFYFDLQIEANFDQQEAKKCLCWIHVITGCEGVADDVDSVDGSADTFYNLLHDGTVLCQ